MRRKVGSRVAVVIGALVVALGAPVSVTAGSLVAGEPCAGAATGPTVAVVVDFGDVSGVGTPPGGVVTGCVPWSEDFRGLNALKNAGFTVRATGQGQVCGINGYPAEGCGKKTGDRKYQYWAYWKAPAGGDSWNYSLTGAATEIRAGVTEGWRFVEGAGSPKDPQPRGAADHDATCGSTTDPDSPNNPAAPEPGAPEPNAPASPASSVATPPASSASDADVDDPAAPSESAPGSSTTTNAATPDVALAVATPASRKSDAGNILGVIIVAAVIAGLAAAGVLPVTPNRDRMSTTVPRRATTRRGLHPLAWWIWAAGLAAGAMRMTNPLLLGLVLAVVAYVVAARKADAPWAGSFSLFLRLGAFVIVLRMVLEMLFGVRLPGTVLFTLPSIDLPDWAAGVSLGGPVTVEMLLDGFTQGLRLAVVLACFGAANTLASPYRLLRSLPTVLYEAGVVVTVALSFAPQVVMAAGRRRQARRLRGRSDKGLRAMRGIALPVLEGSLDRSVALAASMDARGYGRQADLSPSTRRVATASTVLGLIAICGGVYGLLDSGAPDALGLPMLGAGALICAIGLVAKGRRTPRTRYRPDAWGAPEWLTVLSGGVALAGIVLAARIDPESVKMSLYPLEWPAVPIVAVVGSLVAVLPAFVAPSPPGLQASMPPSPIAAEQDSAVEVPTTIEVSG